MAQGVCVWAVGHPEDDVPTKPCQSLGDPLVFSHHNVLPKGALLSSSGWAQESSVSGERLAG